MDIIIFIRAILNWYYGVAGSEGPALFLFIVITPMILISVIVILEGIVERIAFILWNKYKGR